MRLILGGYPAPLGREAAAGRVKGLNPRVQRS